MVPSFEEFADGLTNFTDADSVAAHGRARL
jgi:hypothetical protein